MEYSDIDNLPTCAWVTPGNLPMDEWATPGGKGYEWGIDRHGDYTLFLGGDTRRARLRKHEIELRQADFAKSQPDPEIYWGAVYMPLGDCTVQWHLADTFPHPEAAAAALAHGINEGFPSEVWEHSEPWLPCKGTHYADRQTTLQCPGYVGYQRKTAGAELLVKPSSNRPGWYTCVDGDMTPEPDDWQRFKTPEQAMHHLDKLAAEALALGLNVFAHVFT